MKPHRRDEGAQTSSTIFRVEQDTPARNKVGGEHADVSPTTLSNSYGVRRTSRGARSAQEHNGGNVGRPRLDVQVGEMLDRLAQAAKGEYRDGDRV